MSWYRTEAGLVRFPYISGLAASPRIGRTFGRASDTFKRSRKARGEISIAVIVACRQMSERWLTVVPFPPPRYKTDVASPYGQTRPPHFRYAASFSDSHPIADIRCLPPDEDFLRRPKRPGSDSA